MAFQPSLQLAVGNNNAAGLAAVETTIPFNSDTDYAIQSWGRFSRGLKRMRADGTLYHVGFPSTSWLFPVMTFTQYVSFQTTYCGGAGGFSGIVTIKTNTTSASAFSNWNATLLLPHPSELQVSASRHYYLNVAIQFVRMVAL